MHRMTAEALLQSENVLNLLYSSTCLHCSEQSALSKTKMF